MKYGNSLFSLAIAFFILGLLGCSHIEPKHGTRVYIEYESAKSVDRATMGNLNYYLVNRSRHIMGVSGARIESVKNNGVVLLLPGKKVSRKQIERLTLPANLQFVILDKVATKNHPNRPWKLNSQMSKKGVFVFVDSRGNKIDTAKQPDEFIKKVVGGSKSVITGEYIKPTSSYRRAGKNWAVMVRLNREGMRLFHGITKAHRGEYLALIYDKTLISAALIDKPVNQELVFITGFASESAAASAADIMGTGTLPVNIKIRSLEYY